MSFLQLVTLLLRGRAAVISTDPAHAERERVSVDLLWNRATRERRVITNMSHAVAVDVHADLSRAATREGSHAYSAALGEVLDLAARRDEELQ